MTTHARQRRCVTVTGVVTAGALMIALAGTAYAQGNSSNAPGKNGTAGNGSAGKSQSKGAAAPPSRNQLVTVASTDGPSAISTTPIAWVDDASILEPGVIAVSVSAVRWSGGDISEVYIPVASVAAGLAPRVQLSASIPRATGSSDPSGSTAGVSTSFFSAKLQVFDSRNHGVKLAVTPTLQLLGESVAATLGPDDSRARFGLPVSAELDHGPLRVYGGGGYFSPGLWFTGAAVAAQASKRLTVNGGVSHAWRSVDTTIDPSAAAQDRNEVSGGAAFLIGSRVIVFGSVGRTFATLDENGAGTTLSGGLAIWFAHR